MDENLNNIENLFREGLDNNEEMPSPQAWKCIDNTLDKDNVSSIKKKYTSLKRVAILLLILLLGLTIYQFNNMYSTTPLAEQNKAGEKKETLANGDTNESSVITMPQKTQNGSINTYHNSASDHIKMNKIIADNLSMVTLRKNYLLENKKSSIVNGKEYVEIHNDDKDMESNGWITNPPNPLLMEIINNPLKDFTDIKINREQLSDNKILPVSNAKNILIASNTKKKVSKPSRFFISVFFSPDFASYRLQNDQNNNQNNNQQEDADEIDKNEDHEFSSTAGVWIEYKVSPHLNLQTGLAYSNTNIIEDSKTIYAQNDNAGNIKYRINTSSGYGYVLPSFSSIPAIGDSLFAFSSTHTLQYLSVPVAVKYSIAKGKFTLNAMAGVSPNILLKGKIETNLEKGINNETDVVNNIEGLKKVYFSGLAGMGTDYKLNKRLALSLNPTFRFALNAINHASPVKSYPNSVGLAVGLKLGL